MEDFEAFIIAIFRDEAWLRQFARDYHFTNWRDIKMRYRIWPASPALACPW